MSRKALFLDRDGTLIYDKIYLSDPDGVELIPGVIGALERALALGYCLFLFTNQSGIGRGYYSLEDALSVNARMEEMLALPQPLFTETCIAPERPDELQVYRKPSPRFIIETIEKYDLDPAQCYMVGDTRGDVLAAINAGITPILVATGGGGGDPAQIPEVLAGTVRMFADFSEFVDCLGKE